MDLLTGISTRRSVRKFTDQAVGETNLRTILDAGFCAPSARNLRPRHFVVVDNHELRREVAALAPNYGRLNDATAAIIVCGDSSIQETQEFLIEDCSASVQNMLLAIHGLGLGAVWCGVKFDSDGAKALARTLQLPSKVRPIAIIALGHPAETPDVPDRYDEDKVHWNGF